MNREDVKIAEDVFEVHHEVDEPIVPAFYLWALGMAVLLAIVAGVMA